MIGLWLWCLVTTALAQDDPNWWIGLPVASVGLQGPDGGLPEESLGPLLRVRQGEAATAALIRLDLATLFRVGEFSAVEADAAPFPYTDDQGNMQQGVQITYLVYPASKTSSVSVQGSRSVRTRDILDAANVTVGQPFYPDLDGPIVERRVLDLYHRRGYPQAVVEVDVLPSGDEHEVWIRIGEGPPNILDSLTFVGDLPEGISTRKLERWARKEGVQVGRPFADESVKRAQYRIRRELGQIGGVFKQRRGWISARITHVVVRDSGKRGVTFTIEPGPRLEIAVNGLGWRPRAKVREALGIDERLRLTRGFLEEAPDRMNEHLRREGYLAAHTEVSLDRSRDVVVLQVNVERGPVHTLRDYTFRFSDGTELTLPRRTAFEGAAKEEGRKLVTVMEQASDDVLRKGYYTDSALDDGLSAASTYYQSRGYLDAELDRASVESRARRGWGPLSLLRALGGQVPREVSVIVDVDRGAQTVQGDLAVQNAADDVDISYVSTYAELRKGEPFSPQALELLKRRVIEEHRARGYLDADARVITVESQPFELTSTIVVEPGRQVLLRSVVTQGPRRTRPSFVRRVVDLNRGEPLTSTDLDRVKRDLYELGVFRTVDLEILGDDNARDLVIAVKERAPYAFEVGGGINTDEGVRVFGRATRRNLLRMAHHLDLYGLVGIEYNDVLNPEWRVAVSYTAPRFPLRNQSSSLQLLALEQIQERTWTLGRSGVIGQLESQFGDLTLRGALSLEARRLEKVDAGSLIRGEPWYDLLSSTFPTTHRIQESIEGTLLYDRRDDPLAPRRGFVTSLFGEWSPRVIHLLNSRSQVQAPYLKGQLRFSAYLPLGALTLRLSGEGALARSLGQGVLPLEERYRLGGTGSMRGYQRDVLGPKNLASRADANWPEGIAPVIDYTLRDETTRWVPTGGDSRAVGIAEILLPFTVLPPLSDWDGYAFVLFVDAGNVWFVEQHEDILEDQALLPRSDPVIRVGTGVGLRFDTPVGPFQLDFGLNPQRALATEDLQMLLRGEYEEPSGRLHLTLGAQW